MSQLRHTPSIYKIRKHATRLTKNNKSDFISKVSFPDMIFVKNFTPPDFQAKTFTPSISPKFNSFSHNNTKKMRENEEIYTAGKNFTLPPAVTGWTNSTSGKG